MMLPHHYQYQHQNFQFHGELNSYVETSRISASLLAVRDARPFAGGDLRGTIQKPVEIGCSSSRAPRTQASEESRRRSTVCSGTSNKGTNKSQELRKSQQKRPRPLQLRGGRVKLRILIFRARTPHRRHLRHRIPRRDPHRRRLPHILHQYILHQYEPEEPHRRKLPHILHQYEFDLEKKRIPPYDPEQRGRS